MSNIGRPPIEITPEVCEQAKSLAAQGLTIKQIALTLQMGYSTVYEKMTDYPEFAEAIEAGRAMGVATVTNALFNKAKTGDVQAIRYYLNNRDPEEWAERQKVAMEGTITHHEDRLAHLR